MPIRLTPDQVRAFARDPDDAPDALLCPIGHDLLRHPVQAAGNPHSVYSRDALAQALNHKPEDPKTRMPLDRAELLLAPQHRRAVHRLQRLAATYAEHCATLPDLPPERATAHQGRAQQLRLQRAFELWREHSMPVLPAARPVARLGRQGLPRDPMAVPAWGLPGPPAGLGPHGMGIQRLPALPEPAPATVLGRLWARVSDPVYDFLLSLAVRLFFTWPARPA